jgi:transposase
LDVHAETISVAVAEGRNQVRSLGTIANRPEAVRRILGKLGKLSELKVCYEAGPTGYALYWELTRLGVQCEVIAPSLVPMKSGDRIKTDRRDAERLARSYQAGDLTAVWVPDSQHEALCDLVRAREATKEDQLRAKHRLLKYLLSYGQRPADDGRSWTASELNPRLVLDGSFHISEATDKPVCCNAFVGRRRNLVFLGYDGKHN